MNFIPKHRLGLTIALCVSAFLLGGATLLLLVGLPAKQTVPNAPHNSAQNPSDPALAQSSGTKSESRSEGNSSIMANLGEVVDQEFFRNKRLKELSFPSEYTGVPRAGAPEADKEKIIEVHRRYWENFARMAAVSMDYSCRTYTNGQLDPARGGGWDMDARVDIQPGERFTANGTLATGESFEAEEYLKSAKSSFPDGRRTLGLMWSMGDVGRAFPERCKFFDGIVKPGEPEYLPEFDTLVSKESTGLLGEFPRLYRFSRTTGMLEQIEDHSESAKDKYGYYPITSISYERHGDLYYPSQKTIDAPQAKYKFVETFSNVVMRGR